MLLVFIYVYWCPTPFHIRWCSCFIYVICIHLRILVSNTFPYQMMFMTFNSSYSTTGVTSWAGTNNSFRAPDITPVFSWVRVTRSLVLWMFCRSLFVLLYFSFGHCVVCSSLVYGLNQIKSNNFYWSKNPNKGLSSIQNMTNTTKTTLWNIWNIRKYLGECIFTT